MGAVSNDLQMQIRLILADELSKQLDTPIAKIEELTTAAYEVGDAFSEVAAQMDSIGSRGSSGLNNQISSYRELRMGAMAFSAAAQLGFSEIEMSAGKAVQGHKELQQVIEASRIAMVGLMAVSMGLDPVFAAIAVVAAGAGYLIGQAMANAAEQAQAAAEHIKELRQPFDDAIAAVDKLNKADPLQPIADATGVTTERLKEMASASSSAADAMDRLMTNEAGMQVQKDRINALNDQIQQYQHNIENLQKDSAAADPGSAVSLEIERQKQAIEAAKGELKAYTDALDGAAGAHQRLVQGVQQSYEAFIQQQTAMAAVDKEVAKYKDENDAVVGSVITLKGAVANAMGDWGDKAQTVAHQNLEIAKSIESITSALNKAANPIEEWKKAFDEAGKDIDSVLQEAATKLADPKILGDPLKVITETYKLDIQFATDANKVATDLANVALKAMGEDKSGNIPATRTIKYKIPVAPEAYLSDKTKLDLEAQITKIDAELEKAMAAVHTAGKGKNKHTVGEEKVAALESLKQQLLDTEGAIGGFNTAAGQLDQKLQDIMQKGAGSAFAKELVPTDILAAGTKAIQTYASEYEKAFGKISQTQTKTVTISNNMFDAINKAIDDTIKKFKDLEDAKEKVGAVLSDLANKDPEKYKEFLKAENLAPSTTAVDAATRAFADIAKGIDPATTAAQDYKETIDQIKANVSTEANFLDKKAMADIDAFRQYLDDFIAHYGGIDINVRATYDPPVPPANSPMPTMPQVTGKASGGPVAEGTPYIIGEKGPELFVPSLSGTIISNDQVQTWMQQHMTELQQLYMADETYWDSLYQKHPNYSLLDWFKFLENLFNPKGIFGSPTSSASGPGSTKYFANGYAGMVGPGSGGPMQFVAGEDGEELVLVIPTSQMAHGSGGGGNPFTSSFVSAATKKKGQQYYRVIGGGNSGGGGSSSSSSGSVKDVKSMTVDNAETVNINLKGQLKVMDDGKIIAVVEEYLSTKAQNNFYHGQ